MRATTRSRVAVESVTPRIDSERHCRCAVTIIWDEVYGWLHARRPAVPCDLPYPADAW
jgi:hypothetical protein